MSERGTARRLAEQAIESGTPLQWFEELYAQAAGNPAVIPWADMTVNPNLESWLVRESVDGTGREALVVGCGAGDDAEALAARGFAVTAFDISPSCIDWCRSRFSSSTVEYVSADLFASPADWGQHFDFVFEAYTLQVLSADLREHAIRKIAEFVAPGGSLLVITRGRDPQDDRGQMPWPLVLKELELFLECGLIETSTEDYIDDEKPPVRRFRNQYQRKFDNPADDLSDDELVSSFEDCCLPIEQWTHRSHLRTAFVYVSRLGLESAIDRMKQGLVRYNHATGTPDSLQRGYHETITVAFMRLVDAACNETGPHETADNFCDAHPELLTKNVLKSYYSRDRIVTTEAKSTFVEPDLRRLPGIARGIPECEAGRR